MARAERRLTVRGRAFLAAGATTLLCGLLLGEPDLTRIGVLVGAAPLAATVYLARRRHDLAVRREITPPSVPVGQAAAVRMTITNGDRSTGLVRLEERLGAPLGEMPTFGVAPLAARESRSVEYQVLPRARGRFDLGPLRVRGREPLGMVEVVVDTRGTGEIVVVPATVPLPEIELVGGWSGAGGDQARSYASGDIADATIREYRRGDDLRRVHWASTARAGELMVRREERPTQVSATIIVDNRALAHRGAGDGSTLEASVSAAASIATHLIGRGYLVRLVTAGGVVTADADPGAGQAWPLLRRLAVLPLARGADWPVSATVDEDTVVIALLSRARDEHHAWCRHLTASRARTLALLVDPDHETTAWLDAVGWTCSVWSGHGPLAPAWRELSM